jgi:hypothetical protein
MRRTGLAILAVAACREPARPVEPPAVVTNTAPSQPDAPGPAPLRLDQVPHATWDSVVSPTMPRIAKVGAQGWVATFQTWCPNCASTMVEVDAKFVSATRPPVVRIIGTDRTTGKSYVGDTCFEDMMPNWDQGVCTLRSIHGWDGSEPHTIEVRLESTVGDVEVNVHAVVLDPLE